jgi:hypothetical protein
MADMAIVGEGSEEIGLDEKLAFMDQSLSSERWFGAPCIHF